MLRQLHLLHPQAIPFENIDAYSGLGVSLDLARIADKMLARGRGGYCFEHNRLFQAVLEQLGFRVTPLIARVRWQVPADVRTGLTHMLLRVDLDGRSWFADVAFGSTTQTAPLEFLLNVPQETPHGVFRIAPAGPDEFSLEFQTAKGWSTVYQYGLRPAPAVDFEIGNWYTSSHPQSVFLSDLIISRTAPGLRELLVNDVDAARHGGRPRRGATTMHRPGRIACASVSDWTCRAGGPVRAGRHKRQAGGGRGADGGLAPGMPSSRTRPGPLRFSASGTPSPCRGRTGRDARHRRAGS